MEVMSNTFIRDGAFDLYFFYHLRSSDKSSIDDTRRLYSTNDGQPHVFEFFLL